MIANAEPTPQEAEVHGSKATKKARVGAQRAQVAPGKGKSAKKASPAKKAPEGRDTAEKPAARVGSKTARILELLKRPGGATLQQLMAATEWQPHTVH